MSRRSPPWPPRNHTGYAGLKNQGATCYLNSLLQTVFMTPEFRQAVFCVRGEEIDYDGPINLLGDDIGLARQSGEGADDSLFMPCELQRLLAYMQKQGEQEVDAAALPTEALTRSFNWDQGQEQVQHDLHELTRILFDNIELHAPPGPLKSIISQLYQGSTVNQVICSECGRISSREEAFYDLTIPVDGLDRLERSLQEFTAFETLTGSNRYMCEGCNRLVDARKGTRLRRLPPMLILSLSRFRFNWENGAGRREKRARGKLSRIEQITDRFAFGTSLDLSPFMEEGATGVAPEDCKYSLFSVVSHSGSAQGGHYHALIKDLYSPLRQAAAVGPGSGQDCEGEDPGSGSGGVGRDGGGGKGKAGSKGRGWAGRLNKVGFSPGDNAEADDTDFGAMRRWGSILASVRQGAADSIVSTAVGASQAALANGGGKKGSKKVQIAAEAVRGKAAPETAAAKVASAAAAVALGMGQYDEHPELLVRDIISQHLMVFEEEALSGMSISTIMDEIEEQTGSSWKNKFQKRHGMLHIFLRSHPALFRVEIDHMKKQRVHLTDSGGDPPPSSPAHPLCDPPGQGPAAPAAVSATGSDSVALVDDGSRWLDFNDSEVREISVRALQFQFVGRESAYMLFFRRTCLSPPIVDPPSRPPIPDHLVAEIEDSNRRLQERRQQYDVETHTLTLTVVTADKLIVVDKALRSRPGLDSEGIRFSFDRRQPLANLHHMVSTAFPWPSAPRPLCLHLLKEREAGKHPYALCPEDGSTAAGCWTSEEMEQCRRGDLSNLPLPPPDFVKSGMLLLCWDGQTVGGTGVFPGPAHEPVLVRVSLLESDSFDNSALPEEGRPSYLSADTCLCVLRSELAARLGTNDDAQVLIHRLDLASESNPDLPQMLPVEQDEDTVQKVGLWDSAWVAAELIRRGPAWGVGKGKERVLEPMAHTTWRAGGVQCAKVEAEPDSTISVLKRRAAASLALAHNPDSLRVRIVPPTGGQELGLILTDETLSVRDLGLAHLSRLTLEMAAGSIAATEPETMFMIRFRVSHRDLGTGKETRSAERCISLWAGTNLKEVKASMLSTAAVAGDAVAWRLRATNSFDEAAEILQDESKSLHQALSGAGAAAAALAAEKKQAQVGPLLLLEVGPAIPKGSIQLVLWEHRSDLREDLVVDLSQYRGIATHLATTRSAAAAAAAAAATLGATAAEEDRSREAVEAQMAAAAARAGLLMVGSFRMGEGETVGTLKQRIRNIKSFQIKDAAGVELSSSRCSDEQVVIRVMDSALRVCGILRNQDEKLGRVIIDADNRFAHISVNVVTLEQVPTSTHVLLWAARLLRPASAGAPAAYSKPVPLLLENAGRGTAGPSVTSAALLRDLTQVLGGVAGGAAVARHEPDEWSWKLLLALTAEDMAVATASPAENGGSGPRAEASSSSRQKKRGGAGAAAGGVAGGGSGARAAAGSALHKKIVGLSDGDALALVEWGVGGVEQPAAADFDSAADFEARAAAAAAATSAAAAATVASKTVEEKASEGAAAKSRPSEVPLQMQIKKKRQANPEATHATPSAPPPAVAAMSNAASAPAAESPPNVRDAVLGGACQEAQLPVAAAAASEVELAMLAANLGLDLEQARAVRDENDRAERQLARKTQPGSGKNSSSGGAARTWPR